MRKDFRFKNTVLISFLTLLSPLFAENYTFQSYEDKTNIIELYTSQGCSSCPSADRWVSNLKKHPKLFSEFIPLSFHVTYWDFIGWKDIFANKLNDNRQRYYSNNVWKKNSVYTPQFIINSKEYRRWFTNQSFPKIEKKYGGKLITNFDNNNIDISYFNKDIENEKVYVNIALLGFDYRIDIKRGENEDKVLEHDFVVIDHIQKFAQIKDNNLSLNTKITDKKEKSRKYALAVWISQYNSNILQATGGYITK